MTVSETRLSGVLLLEPRVFEDERGSFFESWSEERYRQVGIPGPFVQDNVSMSHRNVLRGLHYQESPRAQGKLVSVLQGRVFDVAVDLRSGSPTFGGWVGFELCSDRRGQLYLPPGCAHGFAVLSETAVFSYKCTDYYSPEHERSLRWNDPDIGIEWPLRRPVVSPKDAAAPRLREAAGANFAAAQPERDGAGGVSPTLAR